jgi:hypothetical protein
MKGTRPQENPPQTPDKRKYDVSSRCAAYDPGNMSTTWEYYAGWVGYRDDQRIAMEEFRKLLSETGSKGWELVNFQVVTWASEGGGEGDSQGTSQGTSHGTSQGTSDETSDATSWQQNMYKVFVKTWRSSGSSSQKFSQNLSQNLSQKFSHTFRQTYKYSIWYVFKRPVQPPKRPVQPAERPAVQVERPPERPVDPPPDLEKIFESLRKKSSD